jgi:hypothetical protein
MFSILEIEQSFMIHGRGLALIPKAYSDLSVGMVSKSQPGIVELVKPDGTRNCYNVSFEISHSSMKNESGETYGRFSLVILIPSAAKEDVPEGSGIGVEDEMINLIDSMVKC